MVGMEKTESAQIKTGRVSAKAPRKYEVSSADISKTSLKFPEVNRVFFRARCYLNVSPMAIKVLSELDEYAVSFFFVRTLSLRHAVDIHIRPA